MKTPLTLLLLAAALAAAPALPRTARAGPKGGPKQDDGKKDDDPFGEPEKPKDEGKDKPVPKTISFSDYRIRMKTKDGRWWRQDKNYTEQDQKAKVLLKLFFKLPKSESHFDVQIVGQGWEHKLQFDFDGRKVKADNFKSICQHFFENDLKQWKNLKKKTIVKPKSIRLGKKRWKAYFYAFTGQAPWGTPLHKEAYFFKHKDKTYHLGVYFTTTAWKTERITTEVTELLKSLSAVKRKR